MPFTNEQKTLVQELKKRRATLTPERVALVDELSRRMDAEERGGKSAVEPPPPSRRPPPEIGTMQRLEDDLSLGWNRGKADIVHTVGNIAGTIPGKTAKDISERAKKYAEKTEPTAQQMEGHTSTFDQVLQTVGEIPSQVVKFAPAAVARRYGPLVGGAISAAGALDKGPKEAIKAGLTGAAQFYGVEKAGAIKSLPKRIAAQAAIGGGAAAIESGGDPKSIALGAGTGAAFGIPGGHERFTPAMARRALKGGADAVAAVKGDLLRDLAPHLISVEAGKAAGAFRERLAEAHFSQIRVDYALREAKKHFDALPLDEHLEFYDYIQGRSSGAAPKNKAMKEFADVFRSVLDEQRDRLRKVGRLKQYYTDYFPQIFKSPDKAKEFTRNWLAGKRPLAGSGTRFKEKKYPTISDAVAAGHELAFDNPVETVNAMIKDTNRFIMTKNLIEDLRPQNTKHPDSLGIGVFARKDHTGRYIMPQGYGVPQDPAFKVWAPNSKRIRTNKGLATPTAKKRPEVIEVGAWAMPIPVVRVFDNYLSKGLSGQTLYRGARAAGNMLNMAQLGASLFHGGFTTIDTVVSSAAQGIEEVIDGIRTPGRRSNILTGVKDIATAPIAPVRNVLKGFSLKKAVADPAYAAKNGLTQMVDMLQMAGGRVDVDPVYRTNMWNSVKGSYRDGNHLAAFLKLPAGLIERSAMPLMEHFVPYQKLGIFADMAQFELNRMGPGFTRAQQRDVFQKAWRSVDNRMGQLVYDNLTWNKIAKDLAMLTIRSVGWTLGTFREIMGGAYDWGKFLKDAPSARKAQFTHRMAYTVALPTVVATMGALTNYAFTGEAPQSWKDYIAPRTGRKDEFGHDDRIWFPTYLKDIWHYYNDPVKTLEGKIHPEFSVLYDMMRNEDFFGVEIANHKDPLIQRLMDYMGYTAEQFLPMAARNVMKAEHGPETPTFQRLGALVGIVAAPAALKRTEAENYASKIIAGKVGKAARTQEQDNRRKAVQEIKSDIRAGVDPTARINQSIRDGILAPENIRKAGKELSFSMLQSDIGRLDLEEAANVFELANPQEKREILVVLQKKIRNQFRQIDKLSGQQRQHVANALIKILAIQQGDN